jgi:class 3 adenylate cyclase
MSSILTGVRRDRRDPGRAAGMPFQNVPGPSSDRCGQRAARPTGDRRILVNSVPVHRNIVIIDLEKSTHPSRTNPIKAELRAQIYRLLAEAMGRAGIEPAHCDPFEDRGDGVLALIHPVDEVPKTYLLSRLIPVLSQLLTDYNSALPAADRPRRELRLRAVVHAGEVHRDANGYFGEDLDVACRLLDAPRLRRCLLAEPGPLVLVVSEGIYWGIVKHEYDGIREASYLPQIRIHVAGRRRCGWVHHSQELAARPEPPSGGPVQEPADGDADAADQRYYAGFAGRQGA